ncbi:MAG: type 2 isopentenyl-diphosphate Delta-isomerase [Chloroflexota bacterium]|nr:MAG: type 2 isopentenyl-diphosphate Delta-isomerase [Chloroflexota bacterium]
MHADRKLSHLRICLEEDVQFEHIRAGFEEYHFVHQAVPNVNLDDVNLATTLFGKLLRSPLIVSSMTGGTPEARQINRNLAAAAQRMGVAMALGSQRAALEDPSLISTFQVRDLAPDILLLANLGAVQLNYGYGPRECATAVEMLEADALILHLNPLQEALQPGGDTNFAGLLPKIERVCRELSVPVVAKEVGWGLSREAARQLKEAGVAALDTGGSGGTNWAAVEAHRNENTTLRMAAQAFAQWGIPTAESIIACREAAPDLPLIGSGGIRTGLDAAKAIALGADLAGLAWPLLRPATISPEAVEDALQQLIQELRIAAFCTGAASLRELREGKPVYRPSFRASVV